MRNSDLVERESDLTQNDEEIIELSNGCICCRLRGDMLDEVGRLAERSETSTLDPKIIVMGEPLAGLDPARGKRVVAMIERLHEEGVSFVPSTYDVDLAAEIADRICIMADGNIVGQGTPEEVFYDSKLLEQANLEPPTTVRVAGDADLAGDTPP